MRIHAVLVRTEFSANIGAAFRALMNMGGDRLILVDARCKIDDEARALAAGCASQMDKIVHYDSWKDFYQHEGAGLRIGLTRRGGRARKVDPLGETLRKEAGEENLYLIFGPEADGLDAEDLAYTNFACHLPVHGEFGSLNLAQAVLLAAHIAREVFPVGGIPQVLGGQEPYVAPMYFPDPLIKRWLTAMGFDITARKASAYITLRRLFMMNRPTKHEYQVLEAVLQQNIRKLEGPSQPSV